MRTLLIDNYDSFTFNLFQVLAAVNREDPIVVRNDEATWAELERLDFDNIVISPGPGRPEHPKDFGVCKDAIEAAEVPLLGVCLGHQGLAHFCGGAVVHAPEVMHGRLSAVFHDESPLYAGIPQGFEVVRYHSLCVAQPLPACLEVTSWTADAVVMGVAHRKRPMWGVQFHPESICTNDGRQLVQNFRDLTEEVIGDVPTRLRRSASRDASAAPAGDAPAATARLEGLRLHVRRIDRLHDPERAFWHFFAEEPDSFWLDSSKASDARSRFSFMGASGGPLSSVVTADVATGELRVARPDGTDVHRESIFTYLDREIARFGVVADDLPFDLTCGFVGYLGYELKADCEGELPYKSALPDSAFVFADRLIAFDHLERVTYVVCLADTAGAAAGERWVEEVSAALDGLPRLPALDLDPDDGADAPVEFRLSHDRDEYIAAIGRCKDYLTEGDSYEICLTNRVWAEAEVEIDPLRLYRILRHINPAPFSAFLRFGEVAIMSSSPERFLKIHRDGWAEAKPIKGTINRGRDEEEDRRLSEHLRTDEKSRAENLMIADLLRNDLGIVCEIGTVHVPHLMEIESYETVHQLVSTVAGHLRSDVSVPEGIRACFPGGSMTGAPKKRTMEIIDELEGEPRGVYAGAIGYLGLSGAADLSIVIRTIVSDASTTCIGTGGAIVMQSDAEEEYDEILLKARAPMRAIRLAAAAERRRAARSPDEAERNRTVVRAGTRAR